jgi:hypothetical protein
MAVVSPVRSVTAAAAASVGTVSYLVSLDRLAGGLTEQGAAELCWALTDGHLYRLLVAQRSWSTADFNRWLSDSLAAALLPT